MRKFDVFDIKAIDVAKVKYDTRSIMNEVLTDLENAQNKILSSVIVLKDDYIEYMALYDKVYVILDFMHQVSMINRITYRDYMRILQSMDELVREKVASDEEVLKCFNEKEQSS